jgi:hypothetical protein
MAYVLLNRVPNFYNILHGAEILIRELFADLDVGLSISAVAGYMVCTDPEVAKCETMNRLDVLLDSQGNGPIRHVETCPDFFSLQEYTQQNTLSKF